MKQTMAILFALAFIFPCWADEKETKFVSPDVSKKGVKDVMTEETITYTGGPYKEEVFKYRLLKPEKMVKGKKYPLVLFLHGAGERGDNNLSQLKYFPELMAGEEYRKKYPCFLIAPQCRKNKKWGSLRETPTHQMEAAIKILKKEVERQPVDASRIYLTGISMGGYGTWDLATRHPDWFAAIVPICGGGNNEQAGRLVKLPIWAFHGDADKVVSVEQSRNQIAAIKKAGGQPKYTEIKDGGHAVWMQVYRDPQGAVPWLFSQKSPKPSGLVEGDAVPAKRRLTQKEKIGFLGDSITRYGNKDDKGYVNLVIAGLKANGIDAEKIPAGISGNKSNQMLARVEKDVLSKKPTWLLLSCGVNDVWHSLRGKGIPLPEYKKNITAIVDKAQAAGVKVMLLTATMIKENAENDLNKKLAPYNDFLRQLAKEKGCLLADLNADMQKAVAAAPEAARKTGKVMTVDGVHMNTRGNAMMALGILRAFGLTNEQIAKAKAAWPEASR